MEESLSDDFVDFIATCMDIQEECYKNQTNLMLEVTKFMNDNLKEDQ